MPQMPSWRGRVVGVRPFENRIATRRNRGSKSFAFRTRPHNGVKIEGQLQKRTRRRQPQSLYSKTATDKCATCASIGESLARLELRPCWRAAAPDDFALSCSPFDDSFWLRFFFFLVFVFFSADERTLAVIPSCRSPALRRGGTGAPSETTCARRWPGTRSAQAKRPPAPPPGSSLVQRHHNMDMQDMNPHAPKNSPN